MPSGTEDAARLCPLCRRFPCLLLMCSHGLPSSSCCGRGTLGHGGSGRKKAGMSPCADLHKVPLTEALFRALGEGKSACQAGVQMLPAHVSGTRAPACSRAVAGCFGACLLAFPEEDGGCRPRLGSVLAQSVQRGTSCLKKMPAKKACRSFLSTFSAKYPDKDCCTLRCSGKMQSSLPACEGQHKEGGFCHCLCDKRMARGMKWAFAARSRTFHKKEQTFF